MTILVNATTIKFGGALQVAVSFINYTHKNPSKINWIYVVSSEIHNQFKNQEKINLLKIPISPSSPVKGYRSRKKLLAIEKVISPDLVYSIGAPSYVRFKTPEVLRLTNPWLIYNTSLASSTFNFFENLKNTAFNIIKRRYVRNSKFIITQTIDAKKHISSNFNIPAENIYVISNTSPLIFNNKRSIRSNVKYIFTLAVPYNHKNIDLIPDVILHLLELEASDFKFIVTIPNTIENSSIKRFYNKIQKHNLESYIENAGSLSQVECDYYYNKSDLVFLPTLLEVFSATYLEAMSKNIPIVTTDLGFSREICQNSALYFTPKNSLKAAEIINTLLKDKTLYKQISENGQLNIKKYLTLNAYQDHINALIEISGKINLINDNE